MTGTNIPIAQKQEKSNFRSRTRLETRSVACGRDQEEDRKKGKGQLTTALSNLMEALQTNQVSREPANGVHSIHYEISVRDQRIKELTQHLKLSKSETADFRKSNEKERANNLALCDELDSAKERAEQEKSHFLKIVEQQQARLKQFERLDGLPGQQMYSTHHLPTPNVQNPPRVGGGQPHGKESDGLHRELLALKSERDAATDNCKNTLQELSEAMAKTKELQKKLDRESETRRKNEGTMQMLTDLLDKQENQMKRLRKRNHERQKLIDSISEAADGKYLCTLSQVKSLIQVTLSQQVMADCSAIWAAAEVEDEQAEAEILATRNRLSRQLSDSSAHLPPSRQRSSAGKRRPLGPSNRATSRK